MHQATFAKFNGNNFQSWKFNVTMYLKQHSLWGYVTGTENIRENATPNEKAKYQREADKALSTIALAIKPDQQVHVMGATTAKQAMETLCAVFEPKSLLRVLQLKKQFMKMELLENENMITYINRLQLCRD